VKHVVLNIGHGGMSGYYDSGAIGADGMEEHKFNRDELAPLIIKILEAKGYKVTTIIQDKYFSELPPRINALKPDLIISLHFNANDGNATGSETLYWMTSKKSKSLAQSLQKGIVEALGLPDRGIKGLLVGRGSALLRRTNAPCVILEPFFGDNLNDLRVVRKNIRNLANGICDSVESWKKSLG